MKKFAALTMACAAFAASPAYAAVTLPAPVAPCDSLLTTPDATECAGFYADNWLNSGGDNIELQTLALAELGYTWDGDWTTVNATKVTGLGPGGVVDFGELMTGVHYFGIHFGAAPGIDDRNVTAFYEIDFGAAGATSFSVDDTRGFSVAARYTPVTAVPEPATWMMLLLGFAAVGSSLRSRKKIRPIAQDLARA